MTNFISFVKNFEKLLITILTLPELHAKWLNTLSYLENCGAKKIAACEHPTLVKADMLKHAAEEFRHAHYLKQQIYKISSQPLKTYANDCILGGIITLHYLETLDVRASRYLKTAGFSKDNIKEAAYILVTYAIELRAAELYPIYDALLRKNGLHVSVKSILLEEKGHLNEMRQELEQLPSGYMHAKYICAIESSLCLSWIEAVTKSVCIDTIVPSHVV